MFCTVERQAVAVLGIVAELLQQGVELGVGLQVDFISVVVDGVDYVALLEQLDGFGFAGRKHQHGGQQDGKFKCCLHILSFIFLILVFQLVELVVKQRIVLLLGVDEVEGDGAVGVYGHALTFCQPRGIRRGCPLCVGPC